MYVNSCMYSSTSATVLILCVYKNYSLYGLQKKKYKINTIVVYIYKYYFMNVCMCEMCVIVTKLTLNFAIAP